MKLVTGTGEIISLLSDEWKPKTEDIARSLAQQSRYTGHAGRYSVAQHSVIVSKLVPQHLAFHGLMHDAHEAYCGDVAAPIKEALDHLTNGGWTQFELMIARRVRSYYGLPIQFPRPVKEADYGTAMLEIGSVFSEKAQEAFIELGYTPNYLNKIKPLDEEDAYQLFMARYNEVGQGIQ